MEKTEIKDSKERERGELGSWKQGKMKKKERKGG